MTSTRALRRRHALRVAAATPAVVALLGASTSLPTTTPIGRVADNTAQTLLRGRLLDSKGQPVRDATVAISVNPPDGSPAVDYAKALTGPDGRYSVALDAGRLRRHAKAGGLVDIIAIRTGAGDEVGVPQYATLRVGDAGDAVAMAGPNAALVLDIRTAQPHTLAPTSGEMRANSGSTCYVGPVKWETLPGNEATVGIGWHQMAQGAPYWQSSLTYTNTHSTSTTTGFAGVLGYSSLSFAVNGSTTVDSSASTWATNSFQGSVNSTVNRRQTITTASYTDVFRCWPYPSTPPANYGYWPTWGVVVRTGEWLRDYYGVNYDGWPNKACTGPDSTYGFGPFSRQVGQSLTLDGSITLGVSASELSGTFTGSATVAMSSTSGKTVAQTMTNSATGNKHLCGEKSPNLASTGNVGVIVGKP